MSSHIPDTARVDTQPLVDAYLRANPAVERSLSALTQQLADAVNVQVMVGPHWKQLMERVKTLGQALATHNAVVLEQQRVIADAAIANLPSLDVPGDAAPQPPLPDANTPILLSMLDVLTDTFGATEATAVATKDATERSNTLAKRSGILAAASLIVAVLSVIVPLM